jgi:integrase
MLTRGRGRPKKCWSLLNEFVLDLRQGEYSYRHIYEAKRINTHFLEHVNEKKPQDIDRKDIIDFFQNFERHGRVGFEPGRNRIYHRSHINQFLKFCGNPVIEGMHFNDPRDLRPNVDWLDKWQVVQVIKADKTAYEDIIIHLEMGMGLRRCEIPRIRLDDIDQRNEIVTVKGKKWTWRSVPYGADTSQVLDRWMAYRDEIIAQHRDVKDPGILVIVPYRGRLNPIGRTAIDSRVRAVSDRVGFHFSNHTLRRTWARQGWEYGVPVETLCMILGHKDTSQTLRYIGAPIDDMRKGMMLLHQKRQADVQSLKSAIIAKKR